MSYNDTMRSKHKKTLQAVFRNPVQAGINWKDIESLFLALGADVEEGRGSRVSITLNEEVAVFHRPHPKKEAGKGTVRSVREFLTIAGVAKC